MYALLKLRLLRGKMIIFVNTIDRCYRYVSIIIIIIIITIIIGNF